jgi:hypothetical protein
MSKPFQKLDPNANRAERRLERALKNESGNLSEEIKSRNPPLLDDLLFLTTCLAYFEKMLGNARIERYLRKNHKITLGTIERLMAKIRRPGDDSEEETMTVWSVAQAAKELSKLVQEARSVGPQLISVRRRPIAIVVSMLRWNAMLRRHPELEDFFWQRKIGSSAKLPQPAKVAQVDRKEKS